MGRYRRPGSGGKRPGTGRPPIYGEKTRPVTTSVPKSKVSAFRAMVKEWLNPFKKNNNAKD